MVVFIIMLLCKKMMGNWWFWYLCSID